MGKPSWKIPEANSRRANSSQFLFSDGPWNAKVGVPRGGQLVSHPKEPWAIPRNPRALCSTHPTPPGDWQPASFVEQLAGNAAPGLVALMALARKPTGSRLHFLTSPKVDSNPRPPLGFVWESQKLEPACQTPSIAGNDAIPPIRFGPLAAAEPELICLPNSANEPWARLRPRYRQFFRSLGAECRVVFAFVQAPPGFVLEEAPHCTVFIFWPVSQISSGCNGLLFGQPPQPKQQVLRGKRIRSFESFLWSATQGKEGAEQMQLVRPCLFSLEGLANQIPPHDSS